MSSLTVVNVNSSTSTSTTNSNTSNNITTLSTSSISSCQLCIKLSSDDSIWIRPFCTIQCIFCNRNVCNSCCTSIAHDSQLPFPNNHHQCINSDSNNYKLTQLKQYVCFECIIQDRHQIIMKSIYKAISHIMDINIISVISLFSIQECMDCNKTYPKSWSIIQPEIMEKICSKYFKPHTLSIQSLFRRESDQYELRYCKDCHNDNESSIIFNAVYNVMMKQENDEQNLPEIMDIIDIITSYSIGSILKCSNFDNCNNEIIISDNFTGFCNGKDINNNKITFNKALDVLFCDECTINEHRENGVAEYCALCGKCTLFGENVTCFDCGDRFCYDCLKKEENEYLIETKYYFEIDDNDIEKIKYYQYCDNCVDSNYITDDIDIMDDCISSISNDPYQELINDYNYTDYQQIDSYFYGSIQDDIINDNCV